MGTTPKWVPVLFGSVMILMGLIILGAGVGVVPTEDGGRFFAPPLVIASLGLGLILGGFMLWVPEQTPALFRTVLFLVALALAAVVCNWTAFAPGVVYESSASVGPITLGGRSDIGGRIAFGAAALIVDALLLSTLIGYVRGALQRTGRDK